MTFSILATALEETAFQERFALSALEKAGPQLLPNASVAPDLHNRLLAMQNTALKEGAERIEKLTASSELFHRMAPYEKEIMGFLMRLEMKARARAA